MAGKLHETPLNVLKVFVSGETISPENLYAVAARPYFRITIDSDGNMPRSKQARA